MTDIIRDLQELQALSDEIHWLCPKTSNEDTTLYDEDDASQHAELDKAGQAERQHKIDDAHRRRDLALKCLQLLAFDGADAQAFRRQYEEGLDKQFARCDACIRAYYRALPGYMEGLEGNYDAEEVRAFQKVVDDLNVERIKSSLSTVTKELNGLPVERRSIANISQSGSFAIFEALSCARFLADPKLLEQLQEPFRLVQTNKRLRMMCYVPAMVFFLFDDNEQFYQWAWTSFLRFKSPLTQSDFDWCIRVPLARAMNRVDISNLDKNYLAAFWSGTRMIVNKLDKDLITHCLRAMEQDVYRLILEHLQFDDECFPDLLGTLHTLIQKSPHDFWDAMGPISPVTIMEQVFASPSMERTLHAAKSSDTQKTEALQDCLAWIDPFMSSIKPANQTPACRALANQLFGRAQDKERQYDEATRDYCNTLGLRILGQTLSLLHDNDTIKTPISVATVGEITGLVEKQLSAIAADVRSLKASSKRATEAALGLQVLQHAVALNCRDIHVSSELIKAGQALQQHDSSKTENFWQSLLGVANGSQVVANILLGCRELTGMEPYIAAPNKKLSSDQTRLNEGLNKVYKSMEELLDRLSAYAERDVRALLSNANDASAIFAALFSSNDGVHKAALDVVKTAAGENERREALKFVVDQHYSNTISMSSNYLRRIAHSKIFTPMPRVVKLCGDILDVLCDPQDGVLRSRSLSLEESRNTEGFWQASWQLLSTIFVSTEEWSFAGHDKNLMKDFCRDAMQFADRLFDEYAIFTSSIKATSSSKDKSHALSGNHLLQAPKYTMRGVVKWLRLRDEYLSTKSVSLTCKILVRLQEESIELGEQPIAYIEGIIGGTTRHAIRKQQIAELRRALEVHIGVPIEDDDSTAETNRLVLKPGAKSSQQSRLDLNMWKASSASRQTLSGVSSPADTDDEMRSIIANNSKAAASKQLDVMRQRQELKRQEEIRKKQDVQKRREAAFATNREKLLKDRKAAQAANEKEKAAIIAKARAIRGGDVNGAGSGVKGIGVQGKEHAVPNGEGMYVSDDSSDDDESDAEMDRELFGIKKAAKPIKLSMDPMPALKAPQGPVKKKKIIRSAADMRARLQPNLTWLHETVLSWDYFHEGDLPPHARAHEYMKAPDKFNSSTHYQDVFKPLLTLEAWQQFVKAREEGGAKSYDVKVQNRSTVDAFIEIATSMPQTDNKDQQISEGDIVLLSKGKAPTAMPEEAHSLARVHKVSRKKQHLEILYRVVPGSDLLSSLTPSAIVFGVKITSIIPLEREYAALHALQYYDLCDEIVKARPSPLLNYSDKQLEPIINNYSVNTAQAKAVKSAIDNDAFTLIQGPPGSGKTKTIVAIVGALLTSVLAEQSAKPVQVPRPGMNGQPLPSISGPPKKLMVCAPSNAAVDELVMRFKEGVRTLSGVHKKVNVIRIGRSEAINAQVKDVTLEELVNARMNKSGQKTDARAKSQVVFQEHKTISEKLNEVRDQLDSGKVQGDALSKLQDDFNGLRRRKQQLSSQIDEIKDQENSMGRQAELNRIKVQQAILDESHVICATLSGSGHDMFRNLNVEFETVVVDEAAQCVEVSSIIPLKYGCSKCVLVGDPKQLPPTVFSKEAVKFAYERSLFVRMQANHPDAVHLLDTQYRMHPDISLFPSQAFYDSRLLDGPGMAELRKRPWHANALLGPYRFFDVQGQHQAASKGHSLINVAEIDFAMQLYDKLISGYAAYDFAGKIGIITPYKSQLRELKDRFSRRYGQGVFDIAEFNTTDAFQGRESEVIIFSCVRASPAGGIGFLQDIRRMNVGLTRAKSSLWVLGNSASLSKGEYWRQMIDSSRVRDLYTAGNLAQLLQSSTSPHWQPGSDAITQHTSAKNNPAKPPPVKHEYVGVKMDIDPPIKTESRESSIPAKRKASSSPDSDVDMKDVLGLEPSESKARPGGSTSKPPMVARPSDQPKPPRKKGDPFMPKPRPKYPKPS